MMLLRKRKLKSFRKLVRLSCDANCGADRVASHWGWCRVEAAFNVDGLAVSLCFFIIYCDIYEMRGGHEECCDLWGQLLWDLPLLAWWVFVSSNLRWICETCYEMVQFYILWFHFNAVTKNKKRSEEIKQMLEDRRNGRSGGSAELQQARAKLNETREKFKELVVSVIGRWSIINALTCWGYLG
jgi:hypothetical protein